MKILVLGNGFDLDHNLPTSYISFLHFCNSVLDMDNPNLLENLTEVQLTYIDILKDNPEIKDTFLCFIKNNHLLNYFNNRLEKQGENWIDFEREIKSIITEFKCIDYELKQSNCYKVTTDSKHKVHQVLDDLGLSCIDRNDWDENTLKTIHKDLCRNLNNFSHALEYYITVFINTTCVDGISPDIVEFDADKVISFNYSDTYERMYGGVRWNEVVDHVHGVANSNFDKDSSIILGVTSLEENMHSSYVEFEKYFQRISKKTGNEYRKWLQSMAGIKGSIEIMFFGHSLDSADSDIIKDLICNENATIFIYYHNAKAHQQIVANLIEILGKEQLINYVSGQKPKIQFVLQEKHQNDNTAGLEITRDIRNLYRMYLSNNTDVENLLLKIKKKINEKNIAYFYSQKKTISLFEALKYNEIDITCRESFLEISKCLAYEKSKNGRLKFYNEEYWYDHTLDGDDIPCDKETSMLINEINACNEQRFKQVQERKIYSKILNLKRSEEIKSALLELFTEDNPTEEYWEQLNEFIYLMLNNKMLEEALAMLRKEQTTIFVKSKIKHFINTYHDCCFNDNYNRQMANNYYYEEDM